MMERNKENTSPESEYFECHICKKTFKNKRGLTQHMHMHNRKRECESCGASFSFPNNLKRHKQEVHGLQTNKKGTHTAEKCKSSVALDQNGSNKISFSCRHCQNQFSTYRQLVNHIEKNHILKQRGGRQETNSKHLFNNEMEKSENIIPSSSSKNEPTQENNDSHHSESDEDSGGLRNDTVTENSNVHQSVSESALRNQVNNRFIYPRRNERYDMLPFLANSRDEIMTYLKARARQLGGIKWNLCVQVEMQRDDGHESTISTPYFRSLTYRLLQLEELTDHDLNEAFQKIFAGLEKYQKEGSNWFVKSILKLEIHTVVYQPLSGSTYIPLPKTLVCSKSILNIQNIDNKCFLYCVLASMHPQQCMQPEDPRIYEPYEHELVMKGIQYPVAINDILKFERKNDNISINVFGFENDTMIPLRVTNHTDRLHHVNLLWLKNEHTSHYCLITDLNRFLSRTKNVKNKTHFCPYCLHGFTREDLLLHHKDYCSPHGPQKVILPSSDKDVILKFKDYGKTLKVPFVIYADFETVNLPIHTCTPNPECASTTPTTKLIVSGFAYKRICEQNRFTRPTVVYRGPNAAEKLIEALLEEQKDIRNILSHIEPIPDHEGLIDNAKHCCLCKREFTLYDRTYKKIVCHHNHLTGEIIGAACSDCNLNCKQSKFTCVIFHNLRNFDAHILCESLGKFKDYRLTCIPQTSERYVSFSLGDLRFLDSFQFMQSGLETLVDNLKQEGVNAFPHLCSEFKADEIDLLTKKGIYPYDYMDSFDRFEEKELPPITKFYSFIKKSGISTDDYLHAKRVFNKFNMSCLGEYHDLYVKTDVLLLADVFESFRKVCFSQYELDPCHFYTSPGLSWASLLKMTDVELELLTDIDKILMFERSTRGGLSQVANRYKKCNNPLLKDYDPSVPTSYLMYLDANNLYGWAMVQPLPVGDFKFLENVENFDVMKIEENGDIGCIIDVSLHYPPELHDSHNCLPLAPEKMFITNEQLSPYAQELLRKIYGLKTEDPLPARGQVKKLLATLGDKDHYILHYRNLQLYVKLGLKIKQIHRVLQFKQKPWMKPYIDFNIEMRKRAKSTFEKNLYKLMNCSVFGKTLQNERKHRNIELVHLEKRLKKLTAKPTYKNTTIFNEDLVAVELLQSKVKLFKPSYCGMCILGSNKLNYQVGRTYNYKYDAEIKSAIFGAMEDHSGLHMSANVHMEVLSKCELVIKLDDVSLTEYDADDKIMKAADREFKDRLEKFPLRVSFQDGNVEEICPLADEPQWVINAKRGILSMFQNNMEDLSKNQTMKETDISGTCDTDYYVKEDGYYVTSVGKSKKLHSCTDRHSLHSAIQGIPYTAESEYQSMPILKSEQDCEYKIDKQSQHLTSVHCVEQHLFQPFSRQNNGALTKTDQKLVFIDSTVGTSRSGPAIQKVSLKFNHESQEDKSKSKRELVGKLTEVCELTKSGVRPETPRLFTELVRIVKSADINTLKEVRTMLEKGTICKDNNERTSKYFLDTLPLAGTSAALNLMTTLLTTGEVTGIEADMWITSLSFIKKPDIMILREVKPLINMKRNEDKTLLSVGTLIHSYCSFHGNCLDDPNVRSIVVAMEGKMAPRCKVTDANFKSTLMALRGLGNAGYIQSAVPTLNQCIKIKSNPIEIRLSAIDAFRRIPCIISRSSLFEILKGVEEDPEVRIAAYKSIMECPSEESINIVKKVLEKEEIKQVGSYIWSHLTNLMETSDRHKQGIREILADETLKTEFDLDMMKYSRNYEKSMFIEPINTGGKIEADLIWSPKSLVPRSSMMNLTVDLFGQSVNLLEFGGRVQGLEYFLEAFYGPRGYFSGANSKKTGNDNELAVKSVKPDKIKRIDKRFESQLDELRASLYMRVFGNELRHINIRGADELLSGPDFNILEFMNKLAKDNDVTYSHSTMFLDTSVIIPTGAGFPMNLSVEGTANLDLKMNGKMDLKNADIIGAIKPSAAIAISSVMSVDAFVTKCGIKMASTLHTSTSLQGKIHMSKSGTLLAEYEMPQNKMEIFDFKSSFFTIHRDTEKEQRMIEDNRQTKKLCSPSKLVTMTGLELCTEISYPDPSVRANSPYFPLTGPVSGGLYLYNRDTRTKYMMNAKSIHTKVSSILHFTFDTPGSKTNRLVSVDLNVNKKASTFEMTLSSPWKTADMQANLVNTKKTRGISGRLNIDGSKSYTIKALMDAEYNAKTLYRKYVPRLQISASDHKPINIQGTLMTKQMRVLTVDLNVEGVFRDPLEAKFDVQNTIKINSLSGSLLMQKNKKYSYQSTVRITPFDKKAIYKPLVSIRTPKAEVLALGGSVTHIFGKKIDYKLLLDKVSDKKVSLKGNFRKQVLRRTRVILGCKIDFTSSPFDLFLNSKIDNRKYRLISTDVDMRYNLRGISRNGIKLVSKINNLSSSSLTKGRGTLNLNIKRNPEYNLKASSTIDHNKKSSEIVTDISYGKDFSDKTKQIGFSFEMDRNFKDLLKANANLKTKLKFPALGLNLLLTGKHNQSDRHLDNSFHVKAGKTFEVKSDLQLRDNTGKLIDLTANYTLDYPGRSIKIGDTLVQKDDNTFVHSVDLYPQKNERHNMVTQINLPQPGESRWNVFSDISFKNDKPHHIEGTFDLNPSDFMTKVSYEKDGKKYAGSVTSKTTELSVSSVSDLKVEVEYPSRRVIMNLNGQKLADKYTSSAALKWDVDKDPKQMVQAGFWLEKPTAEKISGSMSLSYPSRELKFNLLHQEKAKYLTRVDFQWDKDQKITADTSLSFKDKSVLCTGKLTTPFRDLPVLNVKLAHNEDFEQYLTQLDIGYSKAESFDTELRLKKPLSLKTFVGHFLIKSSMKAMKRMRIDFDHKLNPSIEIDSMVKMLWNKQQMQANFELKNITKGRKVGFTGDMVLQSTYSFMNKAVAKLSHDYNGYAFNTAGSFQRNKRMYEFSSRITHSPTAKRYETTGKIDMACPYGTSGLNWDHRLTVNNLRSTASAEWGKKSMKKIALTMNGNAKDTSFDINVETPFEPTGNMYVSLGMNKDTYPMKATIDVKQNDGEMASAVVYFDHGSDNIEGKSSLRIPALDIDSRISAKHSTDKKTVTSDLEAVLSPSLVMEVNSVLVQTQGQSFTHTVSLQTSLKDLKRVSYSTDLRRGSPDSFTVETSIESVSHLNKKTASLSMDTSRGLTAKATVDTIFPEYPTISFDVNAFANKDNSDVSASLEYLQGQFLTLKFNHDIASPERKLISARVSSPSTAYGFEVDHTARDNFLRSDISLQKDDGKYSGVMIQVDSNSNIKSTVIVTLPVEEPRRNDRRNQITIDTELSSDPAYKIDMTSSWQIEYICRDEYDTQLTVELAPTQRMFATGLFKKSSVGKSEFDVLFDTTRDIEGRLRVKSPLMKNIKASFNHVTGEKYYNSRANIIHGGKQMLDGAVTLNLDSLIICDVTLKSAFTKNLQGNMRYDGQLDNFFVKTEATYGKSSISGELTSNLNTNLLQQKLSMSSTEFSDISLEISHIGSLSKFTTFSEIYHGVDRHRVYISSDISPNNYDWTASIVSPLVSPMSTRLTLVDYPELAKFHFEFVRNTDRSDVNLEVQVTSPKIEVTFDLTSPYTRDVVLTMEHTNNLDLPNLNTVMKLSIDKTENYDAQIIMDTKPFIKSALILTSPTDNFESHFEHEGTLRDFRCHSEYKLNSDSSELDVHFTSTEKIEGSLTLKSSHLPEDISVSFEHAGSMEKFKCSGEYSYGLDRSEVELSVDVIENIFANVKVTIPQTPVMTATLRHTGGLKNLNCHVEYNYGDERSAGDVTLRITSSIVTSIIVLNSPYTSEYYINMVHEQGQKSFDTTLDVSVDGQKSKAMIKVNVNDGVDTKLELTSPSYFLRLSHKGHLDDFVTSFDASDEVYKYTGVMKVLFKDNVDVSVGFTSPIQSYETVTATYKHEGRPDKFQCTAVLDLPGGISDAHLSVDYRDLSDVSFTMDMTPSSRFDMSPLKAELKLKNKASMSSLISFQHGFDNNQIKIDYVPTESLDGVLDIQSLSESPISTNVNMKFGPNKITATGNMNLPIEGFSRINMDSHFIGGKSNFDMKALIKSETVGIMDLKGIFNSVGKISGDFYLESMANLPLAAEWGKKSMKAIRIIFDHKLNTSFEIDSMVKILWNKQQMQATFDLKNITKGRKMGFKGRFLLHSTFMKRVVVKLLHVYTRYTFNTIGAFIRNKRMYEFSSRITHSSPAKWFENGKISMECPYGISHLNWDHRQNLNNFTSTASAEWGKKSMKKITVTMNGNAKDTIFNINIETPFKPTGNIYVSLGMNKDTYPMKATIDVKQNDGEMAHAVVYFDHGSDIIEGKSSLRIPSLDIDSRISAKHSTDKKTVTSDLEAVLSHSLVMEVNSVLVQTQGQSFTHTVSLQTSLKDLKRVSYSTNLRRGSPDSFTVETSVESVPHLNKKTASLSMDTSRGLTAKATVDTIFLKYPTVSFDVNAIVNKDNSDVVASLEYLQGHFLTLKFNHDIALPERKLISAGVSSPSTAYSFEVDHTARENFVRSDISLQKDDRKYSGVMVQVDSNSNIKSTVIVTLPVEEPRRSDRRNQITIDTELSSDPAYKIDMTSSWQIEYICRDEYDTQLTVELAPTQRISATGWFKKSSVGKSEFDVLFDTTRDIEGRLRVKSPLIKNIKASLNHVTGEKYYNSRANIIHGGKQMLDGAVTLNLDSSVIGDITLKSAFTKNLQVNVRNDGQLDNFIVKTEATYGMRSISGELSSFINTNLLQQKLSLSSTEFSDISLEISHIGNLRKFTTFSEINHGVDRHRIDLSSDISPNNYDWTASIVSPLVSPMSTRLTLVEYLELAKAHFEFVRNTDRSDVNLEVQVTSPKIEVTFDLTSPYTKDVVATMQHINNIDLPNLNTVMKLSIDKKENYDAQIIMDTKPFIKSALILTSPTDNFESHFEHEGTLQDFRCYSEYKLNSDSSVLDVHFASTEKFEGSMTLKSLHLPEDVSVSFEHAGSMEKFKCTGEYSYGFDRSTVELSVDVIENIFANVKVTIPRTPVIRATLRHTGGVKNMNCHVEYNYGDERSVGYVTLRVTSSIVTSAVVLNSPYTSDYSVNMVHGQGQKSFETTLDVSVNGQKSKAMIKVNVNDGVDTKLELTSPSYFLRLSHKGHLDDFLTSFDASDEVYKYTGVMKVLVKDNIDVSVGFTSPIQSYETVTATYKHEGQPDKFQCTAVLDLPGGISDAHLNVDYRDLSDVSFTMDMTPSSRFDLSPLKAELKLKNKASGVATSYLLKTRKNSIPAPSFMRSFDKPINYAIDMVKLPARHLPIRAVNTLKYVQFILPELVNTRIKSINNDFELEKRVESMIEAFFKVIEKEVTKDLLKLKGLIKSPITVYEPERGEIQAEFFLPIPLRSLDVMPVVVFVKYMKTIGEKVGGVFVRVLAEKEEWMPPFSGIATVSQGQTITTYDGYTYDLDSDCTFILTRDYHDGNFTIIRSNGDDPTVTILTNSKPVQIKLNGEVYIGKTMVELPVMNNEILVDRQGSVVIVEGKDFSMLFDVQTDLITVKINGWYFGKTGGLLGIYDNEPSNDHMTSFNKVIHNSNRFARTWEVGTATCR